MSGTLLIGGTHTEAFDGRTIDRLDPITGRVASTSSAASAADVRAAADAAQAAFDAWSAVSPEERGRPLPLKPLDNPRQPRAVSDSA